jgi:hypothetical protein
MQPIEPLRSFPAMIISIPVSDTVVREAKNRGLSVEEFVESLIDKGMPNTTSRPILNSAMERIRSLHNEVSETRVGVHNPLASSRRIDE